MNYLTEINLFYSWLETNRLSPGSIALWHGLIFIANRSGWCSPLSIPLSTIELRTGISRASIYRERDRLRDAGLIEFSTSGGRASGSYKINYLSQRVVSHGDTQANRTPQFVSHSEMQSVVQNGETQQFVSQSENIYKLNKDNKLNTKETIKEKSEVAEESAPPLIPPPEKKEKVAPKRKKKPASQWDESRWLDGLDPPWQEMMLTWLNYKRSRNERYKSELSAAKCLEQLRRLSEQNANTAQQILDQSIANNWAGLFELKRQAYYARNDTTKVAKGQHIGQILQPESEEKRNKILANFGKK